MKRLILAATAAAFLLAGCNANQETASKILIQAATMKLIEKKPAAERAEKAAEIKRIADKIGEAAGSAETSVAALQSLAMSLLPANLEPSERITAMALISLAADELNARVGNGELDPAALIKVRTVVGWVSQAASFYAG